MKIVDFTCDWADGNSTPDQVFDAIWNGANFWTPFAGTLPDLIPDAPNGFKGSGDPAETLREDEWGNTPMCYTYRHDLWNPYPIPETIGAVDGQTVDGWLDLNYARCGGWVPVLRTFAGTHGLATGQHDLPPMRWRFVDGATGDVSHEDYNMAITRTNNNQRAGGYPAQPGDLWYRPFGVWVNSHGQANPYTVEPVWNVDPSMRTNGSDKLHSFFFSASESTDHVIMEYNGRYYDPSYEHGGGASYATINEMANESISFFYYDAKYEYAGKIESIDATFGGAGYTDPPNVDIICAEGIGTGAAATAVTENGIVLDIILDQSGSGYIPPATVTITGGGGANATATATVITWEDKTADLPLIRVWYGPAYVPNIGYVPGGWHIQGNLLRIPRDLAAYEMMEIVNP